MHKTDQFLSTDMAAARFGAHYYAMTCYAYTVKPRPEAHMDMILIEVFLKSIDLLPQQQILQRHYLYYR